MSVLQLVSTARLNIAKELIKLAASKREPHAVMRADERGTGVDQLYLDDLNHYVRSLQLQPSHYYVPISAGVPGTLRGFAAFKPTAAGPVLATVLSPGMIPKGQSLLTAGDGNYAPKLKELDNAMHSRKAVKQAAEEYAPGIPDKNVIKRIPFVGASTAWDYVVHEHHADKAGKHYDLRLGDSLGDAHSWALRYWPEPGERRLAVQQPTHTKQYMSFQGTIEDGYGKGSVSIWKKGKAEILKATNSEVLFHLEEGRVVHEFALIRTKDNQWLLINKTPTRARYDVPTHKPKLKETTLDDTTAIEDDAYVAMSKLDGAHTIVSLHPSQEKQIRLFSYREPKTPGRDIIEYTHKVGPPVYGAKVPSKYKDTVLRGETWGVDKDGKPLHSSVVAGLLNANLWNSRDSQATTGNKLRTTVFDVVKYRGKDVSEAPFGEKLKILRDVAQDVDFLELPSIALTKEEKQRLVSAVRNDPKHETEEGLVLQHLETAAKGIKAKIRPDHDVYVRSIFQAISKDGTPHARAGGFEYSWTEDGPIVGRVGTGFDHDMARDMWANQDRYIGRVAKVFARTKYKSGALGEPSFNQWHPDKGKQP